MRTKTLYSYSYELKNEETGEIMDVIHQKEGYTIYINLSEGEKKGIQVYDISSRKKHTMTEETFEKLVKLLRSKIEIVDEIKIQQLVMEPTMRPIK